MNKLTKTMLGAWLPSAVLVILGSALYGCMPSQIYSETERYARDARVLDSFDLMRSGNWTLPKDPAVSIVWVKTGNVEVNAYNAKLANAVVEHFGRYFPHTHTATQAKNLKAALQFSRRQRSDYLLVPRVLVFENSIGDWAEWRESQEIADVGRDKVRISLALYHAPSGNTVENAYIEGRSGWLTFIKSHPDDLLGPSIEEYARQLYGNHQ